ncbi:MAG: T9SS type A sorting domain-containing protein [Ignavibacteria bacterium]|nr:T9SS type A sorting domain-containing protein [Ignavibacteria bacterium]
MNNRIKIIIILFALCTAVSAELSSQDFWLRVPSPTNRILTKCWFVDSVYGWVAGDSGTIINTTNSGASWSVQNSGILNYNIDDVFFLNRRLGWALSNDYFFNGTFVLKTTNGGLNWSMSNFPDTTVIVSSILFTDSLKGYATGFSGKIFRTTNGGGNWDLCIIDTAGCPLLYGFPKHRLNFINSTTGYACGGQYDMIGAVWRTTNSGVSWNAYCITPEPLFDVKIINSTKIIASGGDFDFGAITSTTWNNGGDWTYNNIGYGGIGRDLAFRTEKEIWMPLAFAQSWAVHLDSGNINIPWIGVPAPDSTAVYAAVFKSPTFGFAFGSYGAIMRYNTAVIGLTPGSSSIPGDYSLGQNYPNPFNPTTNIVYKLAKSENVVITLYDLLGKQVKVFVEGVRPAGFNRFRFINSGSGLASGVYIYKIEAGTFVESKKMVIVK